MKNIFKIMLTISLSILPLSCIYAEDLADQKQEKTFILKFTSKNLYTPVRFSAQYMVMNTQGSYTVEVENVTPYRASVKGNFVGVMMQSIEKNPEVKLEILEEKNNEESLKLSGTGHSIFAHDDSNGMGFINAR
jgi:hypothetical protein